MKIAADGTFWIGARHGYLYKSSDKGQKWTEVRTPADQGSPDGVGGDDLGTISFFDKDHALIVGQLGLEVGRVLRTADGGQSWQELRLPFPGSICAIQVAPSGLAWLGGSGPLQVSRDFGATWIQASPPFPREEGCTALHFDTEQHGVAGSDSGSLCETRDGGRSWRQLSSPYNDSNLRPGSLAEDGDIWKRVAAVLILGSNVLVQAQVTEFEWDVFWKPIESDAAWQPLRDQGESVRAFTSHPEGAALLLSSHRIAIVDQKLNVVRRSADIGAIEPMPGFWGGIEYGASMVVVFDGRSKIAIDDGQRVQRIERFIELRK